MKKFLSLTLAALLGITAIGCGSSEKPAPPAPAEKPAETPAEKPADAPAEKPAEAPAEKPAEAPSDPPATTPEPPADGK